MYQLNKSCMANRREHQTSSGRLDYIDAAKGFGIILVVLGHFTPKGAPFWYDSLWSAIYLFHMPLFFFISGMTSVLSKRQKSFKEFLLSRTERLLLPYFVAALCFEVIAVCSSGWNSFSLDFLYTYPGKPAVYLWFLPALWICSILSYPLVRLKLRYLFPLCLLSFVLLLAWFPHLPGYLNDAKLYFPYVLFGAFWLRWQKRGDGSSGQMVFAMLTLLLLLVLCNYLFSHFDLSVKTLVGLVLALLCSMCVLFAFQYIFTPNLFVRFGVLSMLIYLLHPAIIFPFKKIFELGFVSGSLGFALLMFSSLVFSLAIPYYIDLLISRFLPSLKILYGLR